MNSEYTIKDLDDAITTTSFSPAVIVIDDAYLLSVAFGVTAYSIPRKKVSAQEYTELEVALIRHHKGINVRFVQPRNMNGLKTREWAQYWNSGTGAVIAPYLSKDVVVQIINDVAARKNYGG